MCYYIGRHVAFISERESIMTYAVHSLKAVNKMEIAEGSRISRITFKSRKDADGKVVPAKEALGCVIPALGVSMIQALSTEAAGREYLIGCIERVQDALIRRATEAGKLQIFDDQIGLGAMLAWMTEENAVQRFSKESIKVWFDTYLREVLEARVAAKLQGIAPDKLQQAVDSYLASFQVLAGRAPTMSNAVKTGLIRALELLPEGHDTATGNEIASRLAAVTDAAALVDLL